MNLNKLEFTSSVKCLNEQVRCHVHIPRNKQWLSIKDQKRFSYDMSKAPSMPVIAQSLSLR